MQTSRRTKETGEILINAEIQQEDNKPDDL